MHIFKPPFKKKRLIFWSNFGTSYLFDLLILVIEITGNGDDVTKHGKIMQKDFIFLTYHMYLTFPTK